MPRPLALVALFLAAVFVQREFTLFRSLITGQPFPRLDALLGCALKLSLHLNPDPTGFSKQDAGLIDFYRYTATMGQARLEQLLATHRDVTDPTTLRVNANTSVLVMHKPHVTGRTKVCVYFHGGGTVVGSADDFFFRDLSRHTLVFSVAYPLAPTNPYPQGLDGARTCVCVCADTARLGAYAALVYAYEHASELGGGFAG
jgi:acetyl esterase/lipase